MTVIDLNGYWQVKEKGGKEQFNGEVPGCIHTDLIAAGKIDDPFYRDNEEHQIWIGETDWIYSRTFEIDPAILRYERVFLRFEGLDTLAGIELNGTSLGCTDNMFRTYEFEIKKQLRTGSNHISVTFASPVKYAEEKMRSRYLKHAGAKQHTLPGINYLRKEQCNFGWDWGPRCPTCGIWRPVKIIACGNARIKEVICTQNHLSENQVMLDLKIAAEYFTSENSFEAKISLASGGEKIIETSIPFKHGLASTELNVVNPRLWWPNGLGAPNLYDLEVTLQNRRGDILDSDKKRIGLRTLRLIREFDDYGQSFYFQVNNVPFYAKGANWIPGDVFQSRMNEQRYRKLIKAAKDSHMNILRVWGGGIYEEDTFYDLCDEMGICIWQDFIFSCAAYPAFEPNFMDNVRQEAEENVKRLRHHACICLWCGNNEIEQCRLVADNSRYEGLMEWKEYALLFDRMLPDIVQENHSECAYWPSSEHTPVGDRNNSRHQDFGDAHLWNVWHGLQPFEWYRGSFHRFCSEFGFQSFPAPKTINTFTLPEDRNPTSPIMEKHQRCIDGNNKIIHYLLNWYRFPNGFDNLIWLSQIQQGMAIKYAVEHWRRNMHRCMGAIYWQLNDCWPVASWSSIDSQGRWKALHYFAERFFNPLLISGVENPREGTVEVHISNDRQRTFRGEVRCITANPAGETLYETSFEAEIPALSSRKINTLEFSDLITRHGSGNLMIWLYLYENKVRVSNNFIHFVKPKHLNLTDPEIHSEITTENNCFTVKLTARKPALWTWLELEGYEADYDRNFICISPTTPEIIRAIPETAISLEEFKRTMIVKSIYNTFS